MINNKEKSNSILILAGKLTSIDSFYTYEYFNNIGNTLMIERILNSLDLKKSTKKYIAVSKIDKTFTSFKPFAELNFINVGFTNGVIETIEKAINLIKEDNISIIPITTIPDKNYFHEDVCYFSDLSIPKENWSSIKIENGKKEYFFKADINSIGIKSFPFTGRITAKKFDLLNSIKNIHNTQKKDLLYLAKNLIEEFNYEVLLEKWYDSGHDATYHQTKITSFTSRFFNNISYNNSKNTIIKKSKDYKKLNCEVNFYNNLPIKLKKFFPYIFNSYKKNCNFNYLEIEFIPYPNLSELFLFKKIGPNAWFRIINSISKVYEGFYLLDEPKIKTSCSWLYSEKLILRYESIEKFINNSQNQILKKILNYGILVNSHLKINSLKSTYKALLKFLRIYEKSVPLYIGHGDLCFNNILVEHISGTLKLIDPKAFFYKDLDLFGLIDPNYDLSKLNHSFRYLYDSVVNNLFSIDYISSDIQLKIFSPKEYNYINKQFKDIIINQNIDNELLRILTSNLFISMLPLHIDDEERLIVFSIIASVIFQDLNFDSLRITL